jgi:hypothetical protein
VLLRGGAERLDPDAKLPRLAAGQIDASDSGAYGTFQYTPMDWL